MPILKTGTATCQCTVCDEYFNSDAAFQKHRVFADATADKAKDWAHRRCLTAAEMAAIGMAKNARDLWVTEPMPADDKRRAN